MALLKKINIKVVLIAVICLLAGLFLFLNEFGLMKYIKLRKEVSGIKKEIEIVNEQNRLLRNEVDSLQRKIPAKIEKTAREKYNMIRKGEKTIEIITK
jgi:cell division protein FtsB